VNPAPDSVLLASFNSAGFSAVPRGVLINRTFLDLDGITQEDQILLNESREMDALTVRKFVDPIYQWTIENPALATFERISENNTRIKIISTGRNGTSALTLVDTANTQFALDNMIPPGPFTRTIRLVFGTGIDIPPEPLKLNAPQMISGGGIRLTLEGELGRNYTLQSTSDFKTWSNVGSVAGEAGEVELSDSPPSSFGQRFYRVKVE
jgi:hypothetical protein